MKSDRQGLDNGEVARHMEYAAEAESGACEQRAMFVDVSLLPAGEYHHCDISESSRRGQVCLGNRPLRK